MDYQETIEVLRVKVRKLEQLVKLKDKRIDGMFYQCVYLCVSICTSPLVLLLNATLRYYIISSCCTLNLNWLRLFQRGFISAFLHLLFLLMFEVGVKRRPYSCYVCYVACLYSNADMSTRTQTKTGDIRMLNLLYIFYPSHLFNISTSHISLLRTATYIL